MTTTTGETWIRTIDRATGRPLFVGVPSKSTKGKYYLVTTAGCACRGYQYRSTCSHYRAVRAEIEARQPVSRHAAPISPEQADAAIRSTAALEVELERKARQTSMAAAYHSIFSEE